MKIVEFPHGYAVQADCTLATTRDAITRLIKDQFSLIVADPPYGRVLQNKWDRVKVTDVEYAQHMIDWTNMWSSALKQHGAFYCWGGIGTPNFRPFYAYALNIEKQSPFQIATHITWSKRRGYGVKTNFLFTREELLYMTLGNYKRPATFNIPLLEKERGYVGYNKKYPAKSKFLRRTNVWHEPELLRNKLHVAQKANRVVEIPIEVSTNEHEWVLDLFAGAGTTSTAAIRLNRRFVAVEFGDKEFDVLIQRLENEEKLAAII